MKKCYVCKGRGTLKNTDGTIFRCPDCGGTGNYTPPPPEPDPEPATAPPPKPAQSPKKPPAIHVKQNGVSRPQVQPNGKGEQITITLQPKELAVVREAAMLSGVKQKQWIHHCLVQASQQRIHKQRQRAAMQGSR